MAAMIVTAMIAAIIFCIDTPYRTSAIRATRKSPSMFIAVQPPNAVQ